MAVMVLAHQVYHCLAVVVVVRLHKAKTVQLMTAQLEVREQHQASQEHL
jgi:hypothetical protein